MFYCPTNTTKVIGLSQIELSILRMILDRLEMCYIKCVCIYAQVNALPQVIY